MNLQARFLTRFIKKYNVTLTHPIHVIRNNYNNPTATKHVNKCF